MPARDSASSWSGPKTRRSWTSSPVTVRPPRKSDEARFLAAVARSRSLHHPWVQPPSTAAAFRQSIRRWLRPAHAALLVLSDGCDLVGIVNISEIVRGSFRSAYLGYYAFEPLAGKGLMREGLAQSITYAFTTLELHRLEANIQPGNSRSIGLVESLGFRREGYSPRYLKIAGRWRDHERWAILAEDWKKGRAGVELQSAARRTEN